MKTRIASAALALLSASLTPSAFATDVGVSISIGQPGFYGRIDIGGYPPPRLIYREPLIIRHVHTRPPIYMRVPPGHAKHWDKHCHEYAACGERVYFVEETWYTNDYAPRYREQHRDRHEYRERRENDQGEKYKDKHGKGNEQ